MDDLISFDDSYNDELSLSEQPINPVSQMKAQLNALTSKDKGRLA
jgi:hypothetical protein